MRAILYSDNPKQSPLAPLFEGVKTLGHRGAWRSPRYWNPSDLEECDLVAVESAERHTPAIVEAYRARNVAVAIRNGEVWHHHPDRPGSHAEPKDADFATGDAIVEWLGEMWAARGAAAQPKPFRPPLLDVLPDGAWAGKRCFILGGGPSLKGVDLARLKGELVIGVNRAFELLDPAILYSMDHRFMNWLKNGTFGEPARDRFNALQATKVWLEYDKPNMAVDGIYRIQNNQNDRLTWSLADGFCKGDNSGFGALNLALCLGCTEIYLLGFDLVTRGEPQKWWHDGYPKVERDDVYQRMRRYFDRYAPQIAAKGVRVVNLNPASGLKCFEFGRLEDLPPGPARPLVVGYYTVGTGYEAEARKMVASAHRFGLECDVRGIESLGGWQANTYHKATFLRAMLDEHPDRDLLWLDADVEVRRYPHGLDDPHYPDGKPVDLAVNVVDWAAYGRPEKGRELNTSVIYLRNNNRVRKILDLWIEANGQRIASGVWEQKVFQDTLEAKARHLKLKVQILPDNYCQIFDLMAAAGDPVIELHQASRRLKAEVGK